MVGLGLALIEGDRLGLKLILTENWLMLGLRLIEGDKLAEILGDGLKLTEALKLGDILKDGESEILRDGLRLILGDKLGEVSAGFNTSKASMWANQRTFLLPIPSSYFT